MRVRDSSPRTMTCGYFYICFIVNLSLVAGQSVHYVLKGREAILPTTIKHPDDILWKHNGDKVIAFDSKEEQVFRQYQGRAALAWDTAELTIADVRYEDSGEYELEALVGDRTHRSQFMLKVLDEVAKPTISCEINDESSNKTSGSRATLLCSSDSQTPESLTFHWNGDGKVHTGQRLTIALGNEPNELQYSCTATNPLQAETTIFITKDCNTERLLNEHQTAISPTLIIIIVVLGLALIILCILLFRFRKKLKKVCFKKGENNDLEKQNTEESKNPLLHRQETFASKQKLPQQLQDDNGNVTDTPQKKEIKKDLENLHRTGTVQKLKGVFDQGGPTKVLPDPQTEAENNTDNDEKTTSHHALSSTIPSPGADGPESKILTDSDREAATDMSQHDNAEKTGAAGGSRSIQLKEESSKAFKQSELQPQPSPQSRPPHVDQESESGSSEAESKDQSDSEEKSHTEPMFDKELHTQPSDHEKAEVSALAVDSETSANEKPDIEKAEKSLLADSSQTKEPTGLESSRASGTPDQDLDSGTGELRSKGQRDVDGKLHTDPVVYDEPQRDSSESDLTRDSGTSTNEKMTPPQSPPDSDLRGVPNNTHNNEETESQPEAQDLVHVDSSSEEPSDVQTSTASVQPGSEKKTDEQESVPPTPPPPSTLSPSVDIRETKDTDGEHKADANSDQVSVETKDKTDKDSDSSGSKHINEPDKSSEGGGKKNQPLALENASV